MKTGFPASKTDDLTVEFRSVAADSFQNFGCAQLAAFHELGSNALDGAPHSGLAQDRIALRRIVGVALCQLVVGSCWRRLDHSVNGVRIVAIVIVPSAVTSYSIPGGGYSSVRLNLAPPPNSEASLRPFVLVLAPMSVLLFSMGRITPLLDRGPLDDAFKRMRTLRYGSKAWWEAHHALHDALRLPPWVFPFDGSDDQPIYPLNAQSETTWEIWRELEAAAKR